MNKSLGFKVFTSSNPDHLEDQLNEYVQLKTSPKVLASQVAYADGVYTVLLTVDGFLGQEII